MHKVCFNHALFCIHALYSTLKHKLNMIHWWQMKVRNGKRAFQIMYTSSILLCLKHALSILTWCLLEQYGEPLKHIYHKKKHAWDMLLVWVSPSLSHRGVLGPHLSTSEGRPTFLSLRQGIHLILVLGLRQKVDTPNNLWTCVCGPNESSYVVGN